MDENIKHWLKLMQEKGSLRVLLNSIGYSDEEIDELGGLRAP